MIEKQYLIPECYINKVPKCDECKVRLEDIQYQVLKRAIIKEIGG